MFTGQIVAGRVLKEAHWPFFRLLALCLALAAAALMSYCFWAKVPFPNRRTGLWVVLRGLAGLLNFLFLSMAVRVGASPGDVAALASVNTVVGALFGFLFLGEQLTLKHGIAVGCTVVGAIMISQPDFIFGSGKHEGVNSSDLAQGYIFAILGGAAQAGIAICSRKTGPMSVMWPTISTMVQSAICFVVLSWTPLLEDYTIAPALDDPLQALGWFALLLFQCTTAIGTSSCGAQWCPAAVSTTVNTAARMVWGYLAQVIIFGTSIELVTTLGALLMLAGVVIMACSRTPPKSDAPTKQGSSQELKATNSEGSLDVSDVALEAQPNNNAEDDDEDDDKESIGSFIAAEFACQSPHSEINVRHRNKPQASSPSAGTAPTTTMSSTVAQVASQTIGAANA